jgi:hypothetical protein
MAGTQVYPFNRSGAVSTKHFIYYAAAERAPDGARERGEAYNAECRELEGREREVSLIALRQRFEDYFSFAAAGKLWAGLAVEGLINCYALVRLGSVFDRTFERLPTVKKLKKAARLCDRVDLNESSEIVAALKQIVIVRNELAHPKPMFRSLADASSAALQPDPGISLEGGVRATVFSMQTFYKLFAEISNDARAATVFL